MMKLKSLLVSTISILCLSIGGASAATMTVDQMNISGDFTSYTVSGVVSGFTDTGDMGHFFAFVGLQNSANGEESITF